MKNISFSTMILLSFLLAPRLDARPGGGGGGRIGGGGGGPAAGFRPSSPSRPAAFPASRPATGARPGTLPAKTPISKPGTLPAGPGIGGPGAIKPRPGTPGTLPAKPGGRPGAGDVGKFLGGAPAGHFPGTPGHRPPGYGGIYHKAEFRAAIPRHFPYHPIYGYPFSKGWYGHLHWHYTRWPVWTVAATSVAVANWIGIGYAGYGSAQAIPYYPVEAAPAQAYDQQIAAPTEVVATGKATQVADDAEWLNLGTFGLIPNGEKDMAYSVQLATTKDGLVRGLQWDFKANTTAEVQGSIQKDTLRIAWQATTQGSPYFETNLDQLTQEESLVNVYNPATKVLISWQVIRVDESDLPAKP